MGNLMEAVVDYSLVRMVNPHIYNRPKGGKGWVEQGSNRVWWERGGGGGVFLTMCSIACICFTAFLILEGFQ